MPRFRPALITLVMLASSWRCDGAARADEGPPASRIRLTDVTAGSGLAATMTSGGPASSQILEVKGGGLALVDLDGDGDLDLFMPNGATLQDTEHGPGARVFENTSAAGGPIRFRDVTATSNLSHTRWSFGVAAGDVDADGRDDLYVCCFGQDVLLRNVTEPGGPIRFDDITAKAGIKDDLWSTGAAFGDLDGDGDLDLYVANYLAFDPANPPGPTTFKSIQVMSGPVGLPASPDMLYENLGGGRFRDVSEPSGIRRVKPSYGLNVAIFDFTGDGKQDIFVGNDSQANFLFRNVAEPAAPDAAAEDGVGATRLRFEDIGLRSGIGTNIEGTAQATMGVGIADVDGNGRPDVFTTNFSSDTNTLHLNRDGRSFDDRTQQYGLGAVSRPFLGWACGFFDLDHDGDEDLLVVNGHVYPQATRRTMESEYEQVPLLFERRGARFERVAAASAGAWLAEAHRDRTAVFGDLDGDGDVDVVIGELNGPLRILGNDAAGAAPPDGAASWIIVELRDPANPGNRRAVGATVACRVGDKVQRRFIHGGGPFQSTIVPMAHFGVPAAAAEATIEVTWPDGAVTERTLATGRRHVVER